jgi:hypothetical protein
MDSSQPLSLPLASYEFLFAYTEPLGLPPYVGSAWRGALGWSLKRAVCVVRQTACPDCLLYRSCVYPYVFETPPPPDARKMRLYPAAPHPFMLGIRPGQTGSPYRLGLTLVGQAIRNLPYFVHALGEAGRQGLGRQRQPFELLEVRQAEGATLETWRTVYEPDQPLTLTRISSPQAPPAPERLTLRLETPLRLKRDERLVVPARFRFDDLFANLLRRLSLLSYFHTDQPLEVDFAALNERARAVPVLDPHLEWYDWTRYSSRQDRLMSMGGILGSFGLEGKALGALWPYLWVGQWTHAGKGATLGMGHYRIEAASLPNLTS